MHVLVGAAARAAVGHLGRNPTNDAAAVAAAAAAVVVAAVDAARLAARTISVTAVVQAGDPAPQAFATMALVATIDPMFNHLGGGATSSTPRRETALGICIHDGGSPVIFSQMPVGDAPELHHRNRQVGVGSRRRRRRRRRHRHRCPPSAPPGRRDCSESNYSGLALTRTECAEVAALYGATFT